MGLGQTRFGCFALWIDSRRRRLRARLSGLVASNRAPSRSNETNRFGSLPAHSPSSKKSRSMRPLLHLYMGHSGPSLPNI